MSEEVSLDFELTKDNKKALEELLKASGIRHFIIETADFGKIDVVEYKEYLKLKEVLDKIKEIVDKAPCLWYVDEELERVDGTIDLTYEEYTGWKDILELLEEIE